MANPYSSDELVLLDVDDASGIATITLNNPSKLNALTFEMGEQLALVVVPA